ncbi:Carboxylesterase NlhH [Roseimaritima multifibrata]|uniref:Carboxylesterase NlhH n=1 Tax=Roseimaritima multifibrata TaxID=1930274 RepID=A0A517MHK5_9BACT|nr:alpha/beta hydrolase [Roseimaritima multifibrata]QDS94368.1 Carboxylesterase NlhH [Roseimaritima multifibrata]
MRVMIAKSLLAALVASAAVLSPLYGQEKKEVQVHRDLVYGEVAGAPLTLDLYLPKSETASPLIVWIHGGGWRAGSNKNPPLVKLTEQGFALASIRYRFTDTAIFPAQIHDCKGAIRWLRANAKRYGLDSTRIAVAGSSAGGHLALLVGTSAGVAALEGDTGGNLDYPSDVQAVIDYFGPSDFVLRGQTQPERAYTNQSGSFALLGGTEGERLAVETERFASPANYISKDDPPLLVFHGTADRTVLLDQSQHMVQRYKAAGLEAELVVLENAGHGGKAFYRGVHLAEATRFLVDHLRDPDSQLDPDLTSPTR